MRKRLQTVEHKAVRRCNWSKRCSRGSIIDVVGTALLSQKVASRLSTLLVLNLGPPIPVPSTSQHRLHDDNLVMGSLTPNNQYRSGNAQVQIQVANEHAVISQDIDVRHVVPQWLDMTKGMLSENGEI